VKRQAIAAVLVVMSLVSGGGTTAATPLLPGLPSPDQVERRAAQKIGLIQPVRLMASLKFKAWDDTHPKGQALVVTVRSFTYADMGDGSSPRYAAEMRVQNFATKDSVQLYPEIRCLNSNAHGNTWVDTTLETSLPPRSESTGVVMLDLPDGMTVETCVRPVLWLQPASSYSLPTGAKWSKVTKLAWAAYLPLTPLQLAVPNEPALGEQPTTT
jgi:hypothetical protein